MALENISNVPQVCSESLLEHFIFNPPPYLPLRRLRHLCGNVSVSHRTPLGKNPGSAPVYIYKLLKKVLHTAMLGQISEHFRFVVG